MHAWCELASSMQELHAEVPAGNAHKNCPHQRLQPGPVRVAGHQVLHLLPALHLLLHAGVWVKRGDVVPRRTCQSSCCQVTVGAVATWTPQRTMWPNAGSSALAHRPAASLSSRQRVTATFVTK